MDLGGHRAAPHPAPPSCIPFLTPPSCNPFGLGAGEDCSQGCPSLLQLPSHTELCLVSLGQTGVGVR